MGAELGAAHGAANEIGEGIAAHGHRKDHHQQHFLQGDRGIQQADEAHTGQH